MAKILISKLRHVWQQCNVLWYSGIRGSHRTDELTTKSKKNISADPKVWILTPSFSTPLTIWFLSLFFHLSLPLPPHPKNILFDGDICYTERKPKSDAVLFATANQYFSMDIMNWWWDVLLHCRWKKFNGEHIKIMYITYFYMFIENMHTFLYLDVYVLKVSYIVLFWFLFICLGL